jgi:hypothetical protein
LGFAQYGDEVGDFTDLTEVSPASARDVLDVAALRISAGTALGPDANDEDGR